MASGFLQVEQQLREALPLTEAKLYGLKKRDVVKAVFGGRGSSRSRERLDRAIATHKAFDEEQRATQSTSVDADGNVVTPGGVSRRAQLCPGILHTFSTMW